MKLKLNHGLAALLVAAVFLLLPAAPVRASSVGFTNLPMGGYPGATFNFTAVVSLGPGEYLSLQSAALSIQKVGSFPPRQANCADLPLSAGSRTYPDSETGGGSVRVTATEDRWVSLPGYGYGPGPASLTYDFSWSVPSWTVGQGQAELRLYSTEGAIARTASFEMVAPASPGTVSTAPFTNSMGTFLSAFAAGSGDGRARVNIAQGTKGLISRTALTQVGITPISVPPPAPPDTTIITSYACVPEAASFEPPASVAITYNSSALPVGLDERNLVMALWNTASGKWTILPSSVNPTGDVVSAPTTKFGTFGILAYIRPAAFAASDLSVTPAPADIGKPLTVAVKVDNTGDLSGNYTVALKVNEAQIAVKEVAVAGKSSQAVSFSIIPRAAGAFNVDINGCTGSYTVKPAPPSPTPKPPATYKPAPLPSQTPSLAPITAPVPAPPAPPAQNPPAAPSAPASSGFSWLPYAGIVIVGGAFCFGLWKALTSRQE